MLCFIFYRREFKRVWGLWVFKVYRQGKADNSNFFSIPWLGLAWLGLAWLGLSWLGLAWLGLAWPALAWPGLAWLGLAWPGLAWLGLAWPGLAWLFLSFPWPSSEKHISALLGWGCDCFVLFFTEENLKGFGV